MVLLLQRNPTATWLVLVTPTTFVVVAIVFPGTNGLARLSTNGHIPKAMVLARTLF